MQNLIQKYVFLEDLLIFKKNIDFLQKAITWGEGLFARFLNQFEIPPVFFNLFNMKKSAGV